MSCCNGTSGQQPAAKRAPEASCCGPSSGANSASATGSYALPAIGNGSQTDTYEAVKDYYGKVLHTGKDLKTSACTAGGAPHPAIRKLMAGVPDEIMAKFYGCGAPLPLGIGSLRVLDLGSGSGRDCYVASALVGESGSVTGVDMTDEQLQVARKYVEEYSQKLEFQRPNMKFLTGHIEYLDKAGVPDESVDLVMSNCVVNLSPDKQRVLSEVYRVLAPGGEFYFSDVYADRRLPEAARKDKVLWGECLSGALYIEDFKRIARNVGFTDPRVLASGPIQVHDADIRAVVGNTNFYSITYRLFKLPGLLETLCEDYGQVAIYKGTIGGHELGYKLDEAHEFETGRPALVCGNTAAMVGEQGLSWLSPHFEVIGNRNTHYGLFGQCGTASPAVGTASNEAAGPAACGACC